MEWVSEIPLFCNQDSPRVAAIGLELKRLRGKNLRRWNSADPASDDAISQPVASRIRDGRRDRSRPSPSISRDRWISPTNGLGFYCQHSPNTRMNDDGHRDSRPRTRPGPDPPLRAAPGFAPKRDQAARAVARPGQRADRVCGPDRGRSRAGWPDPQIRQFVVLRFLARDLQREDGHHARRHPHDQELLAVERGLQLDAQPEVRSLRLEKPLAGFTPSRAVRPSGREAARD